MIWVGVGVGEVVVFSDIECACTLGSVSLSVIVTIGTVLVTFDGDSTLGDCVGGFGSVSALLSVSVIFCRALRVGSPDSKLGVIVRGGDVRMVIISIAVCLKKSSKPTFGIGISPGKMLLCPYPLPTLLAEKNM